MFKNDIPVLIGNGAALSAEFDMRDVVGDAGMVYIPSAWTAAALGFKVSKEYDGDFDPLRDESGSIVQISGIQTAAAGWYKLPDALRGAMWVKLWSQTSGSDTNQAADRSLVVVAKG